MSKGVKPAVGFLLLTGKLAGNKRSKKRQTLVPLRGLAPIPRPLPSADHAFDNSAYDPRTVQFPGFELMLADVIAEGQRGLPDDHRFAVDSPMAGQSALTEKDCFLGMVDQIVKAALLGSRDGDRH